jgi:hypothetical protein
MYSFFGIPHVYLYVRNVHTTYYTIGNNIISMTVTCIQSLGQANTASTEEDTPKFLMYPKSRGKTGPPCLLGPSGPPG